MVSIRTNFIYNSISSLLAIIVPIITTPYISRVLGPEILGEYSYNFAIATYFTTLALLGLNNYGNRCIATVRNDPSEVSRKFCSIYGMQLLVGLIVILLYIFYILISGYFIGWFFLAYVISSSININWFYYGIESFRFIVIRNIIIKIITTICIFAFVKMNTDMWKYALIISFGALIAEGIPWMRITKYINFNSPNLEDILAHIRPNIILFIPVLAITIYKLMDKIILGVLAGNLQVGYFEAAEKLIYIPNALVVSLGTVMLPRMTNLFANDNDNLANEYIKNSLIVVMIISVSMSFGIMGIARELVPLFFGEGYDQCVLLIQFILPSCIFIAIANVIRTQYLIPKRMDKIYIESVWGGAIINFLLNIMLVPLYGALGSALGTFFAESFVCLYQLKRIKNKFTIRSSIKDISVIVTIGIIMYISLLLFNYPEESLMMILVYKVILGILIFLTLSVISYYFFYKNREG